MLKCGWSWGCEWRRCVGMGLRGTALLKRGAGLEYRVSILEVTVTSVAVADGGGGATRITLCEILGVVGSFPRPF